VGLTVYAEGMGLFHKGSGGFGVAPGDVCLTPPPPPAGPLPIPYVNNLSASDLSNGSVSVKVDGERTALEDLSEVATSTGNEPATQGGSVITHKTKGKGFFTLWSTTVKIEGRGVCRHGDMMGQNSASTPPGCFDAAATVRLMMLFGHDANDPCPPNSYKRPSGTPNEQQKAAVSGQTCWVPGCSAPGTVADHQPPLKFAWYLGGCHHPELFKEWAHDPCSTPLAHCASHSSVQGGNCGSGYPQGDSSALVNKFLQNVGVA
jgi:Domain of unknown function (DUF4150)